VLFENKYLDFTQYNFPETNPLDYRRPKYKGSSTIKLANYRTPAIGERKGIVQYVHGYGDYTGRYAYLGEKFAA
jgi:alpha-beta hydrolase superfamily lysophospholipase